jgi:hypothetical protein
MSARNLWGTLPDAEGVKPPVTILREQAGVLARATNNVLLGRVSMVQFGGGGFAYELDIVAPALTGYVYTVLDIEHRVSFYPVIVKADGDAFKCNDEQEFIDTLGRILSSEKVHKVISSLLSLSRAG